MKIVKDELGQLVANVRRVRHLNTSVIWATVGKNSDSPYADSAAAPRGFKNKPRYDR